MKLIMVSVILSVLALVAGCATTEPDRQALVCPSCKSVLMRPEGGLEAYSFAVAGGKHQCPSCQGALTTWFQDDKLRHKCSACENTPYSCAAHGW